MDFTINLEDYVTPEEIKSIAMGAVRDAILQTFRGNETNVNRLVSNLSYEFIFKAVSDAIGEDAKDKVSNKVKELLEDSSSISYELWRKKNVWNIDESPAIAILNKAIKDNEGLIRTKVMEHIDNFHFDDVQTAMYEALDSIMYEMVFKKNG